MTGILCMRITEIERFYCFLNLSSVHFLGFWVDLTLDLEEVGAYIKIVIGQLLSMEYYLPFRIQWNTTLNNKLRKCDAMPGWLLVHKKRQILGRKNFIEFGIIFDEPVLQRVTAFHCNLHHMRSGKDEGIVMRGQIFKVSGKWNTFWVKKYYTYIAASVDDNSTVL